MNICLLHVRKYILICKRKIGYIFIYIFIYMKYLFQIVGLTQNSPAALDASCCTVNHVPPRLLALE